MNQPALNICKTHDFEDSIFYTSVCDCGSPDHEQTLNIELDAEGYFPTCTIYQDLYWADWRGQDKIFPIRIWRRICNAAKYLFTGHVRVSGDHYFNKEEHMRAYANAILGAADELIKRRNEYLSSLPKTVGNRAYRRTSSGTEDVQGQGNDEASQNLSS